MEFHHLVLSTCVLFSFALAREIYAHASFPDEEYWQAVWPNTPIPSSLQELLKPGPKGVEINDIPFQVDDTQYPKTVFLERDLYPGKTMNLEFSNNPFSKSTLKAFFTVNVIKEEYTFEDICVNRTIKKDDRYCAKSLEALVDFVITSKLGKNVQVLSGSFVNKQEKYTVEGVQNLGTKVVACHRLNFKKIVFYCHEITEKLNVFMVSLAAGDGTKTQAIAVCHTNSLCHFPEDKAVIWVPNSVVDNAYRNNFAIK